MKSITFFIHTLGGGGAEKVLVDLINGMDLNEFEITLQPIINTGSLLSSVRKEVRVEPIINLPKFIKKSNTNDAGTLVKGKGGKISLISRAYMSMWAYFGWLISKILSHKVVHSDIMVSYLEGPTHIFVSNINTKSPKIGWVHVDLKQENKSEGFFRNIRHIKKIYNKFDKLVGVSKDVKQSLSKYDLNIENIDVIYNIYDNNEIVRKSLIPLPEKFLGVFEKERINVVSVGRLSNQKGYDRLIKALEILKEKDNELYKKLNVLVVGAGENESSLNDLIIKCRVQNSIKLLGFHDNPYQLIKNSDCFISTSRTEGYSTVVVEAIILGKPVFTTDCSGMSEILDNGKLGYIESNDTEGILKLLEEIGRTDFNSKEILDRSSFGQLKYDKEELISITEEFFKSFQ